MLKLKNRMNKNAINNTEPIHEWFGLSYAQYLTIPRTVLQSMPEDWQERFVKCLDELDESIHWMPEIGDYRVQLLTTKKVFDKKQNDFVEKWDKIIKDPLADYERGRRKLPLNKLK